MIKRMMKILLCIMLLSLCACKKNVEEEKEEEESKERIALIPAYEHYDPEQFYLNLDEIVKLSSEGKDQETLELYDRLYAEILRIYDLNSVCELEYYKDFTSDYYAQELSYINETGMLCEDRFCSAMHEVAIGPCKDALEKHIPIETFRDYVEYEPMTQEMIDLKNRESDLVIEYDGLDIYADDFYEIAGDIYVELVHTRNRIATLEGYDNYSDYADVEAFDRDYLTSELDGFHEAAKTMKDYLFDMDFSRTYDLDTAFDHDGKEEAAMFKDVIYGASDLTDEVYDFLMENELCYLNDLYENFDCGFTMTFYSNDTPFIYNYIYRDAYDISAFCHEFGHFTDAYLNINANPVFDEGCYDVLEIHSTGFDLLSSRYYNRLFDDPESLYEIRTVLSCLKGQVINGCLVDEWERTIYSNPDMTIDEICDLYAKLHREYYPDEEGTNLRNEWMEIPHVFESPMYYISYATSGFAALQLWDIAQDDYDKAIDIWKGIVQEGAYYTGYMQVVEDAGLVPFSETDKVKEILRDIADRCESRVNNS